MVGIRWKNFDWTLFSCFFILAVGSLLSLASTAPVFFWRQLVWYLIGFFVIFIGSQFDWKWLGNQKWFLYGLYWISVLLLVIAYFQPHTIRETKSWIVFGGSQFQPVEIAKLALLFLLADFFSRRHISAWQLKNIFLSFLYMCIPAGLVLLQPDFGSAIVIIAIWVGFLLLSGINVKRFLVGVGIFIVCLVLSWMFVLMPYQKDRLVGFLFPEQDPFGINYNVIQSKIAIGSAGIFGKGFGLGTQAQLNFLPEDTTDFIFAAFVEEWGLVGGVIILLTFFVLFFRLINVGLGARDNYSKFIVLGAILIFLVHFLVNIGSNLGVMPVTGIPLPFFSYGGSSLLTIAILASIIQHIKIESSI